MPTTYEETGLIRAQSKWVRSSARKARVVLVGIRGRTAPEADRYLQFATRIVAQDIQRVLRSAVANAESNHGFRAGDLVVERAFADEGVTIKRFKPRARGRASKIEHKTSHITVLLRPVDGAVKIGDEPATEAKPRRRRAAGATAAGATGAAGTIAPEVDAPEIDTPEIDAPEIDTPEIDTPEIDTPEIDTPENDTPEIESPDVEAPGIEAPAIEAADEPTNEAGAHTADAEHDHADDTEEKG
jgi:large subunit ribosomal protein L22